MTDALTGFATGNRAGKPKKREQQIHTPQCILDVCRALWGRIVLDPCASPAREPFATTSYFDSGLERDWVNGTFVNPPYATLKDWLGKSLIEYKNNRVHEQVLLFPVRPNRVWWCKYMDKSGPSTSQAFLKPLKFEGFKQAFPVPLVLVYTGHKVGDFRYYVKDLACYVGRGLG